MVITHFLWYNIYVPNTVRGVLIVYMDEDLRAQIIYVNGEYRGDDAVGRLMHDFFCTRAADMNYSVLADRVSDFKESDKGVSDMCESLDDLMQLRQEMFKNQGKAEVNTLNSILIKAGRFDDLARATEDSAYQQQLMAELLPTA